MVSKRQREARKRFKAANPNLFPAPQPPSSGDKKKKKGAFKKAKAKTMKGKGSKHPLRVPGMRPGESCFICKGTDHIAKHCPEKAHWDKNKICLLCRQRGHSLKNCPQKDENSDRKYCYNCGQSGHSLARCPEPLQDGGTKFASCFICKEQGHLSKNCPKNTHGIYPKGGCCKTCGAVTHLARDCPNKGSKAAVSSEKENIGKQGEAWQGKLTVFRSGDDLEDDFAFDMEKSGKKAKTKESALGPSGLHAEGADPNHPKKKTSGHKVVNFAG